MWLYWVAGVIFLLSFGGALSIAARKFRQLSLIDTAALPQERDRQKKRRLIEQRLTRFAFDWWEGLKEQAAAPMTRWGKRFREAYARAIEFERNLGPKPSVTPASVRERIAELLGEAQSLAASGRLTEAERRYVEIVKLNSRHVGAYRGLGKLYVDFKQWQQARETLRFLIKVVARSGCAHARAAAAGQFAEQGLACNATPAEHAEMARDYLALGGVSQELGDLPGAKRALEGALVFEPNNPRYLDLFLEACILVGDRERGMEAFEKLQAANPDNQKLPALHERLLHLPSKTAE